MTKEPAVPAYFVMLVIVAILWLVFPHSADYRDRDGPRVLAHLLR